MKRKGVVAFIVSISLALQGAVAMDVHASTKQDAYAAYYKLVKTLHEPDVDAGSGGADQFKLIYLDDDKVPELLAVDTPANEYDNNGTYVYELYTYYDGKAVKLGDKFSSGVASAGGYRGSTLYIPKSGKLYETYIFSGTGEGSDIVYKLKNGKLVLKARGDYSMVTGTQEWNEKSVSDKAYSKKLKKAFNSDKGVNFETLKTMSYSAMRKKLKV